MAQERKKRVTKSSIFDHRYEILSTVGRGRHSVVYRARVLFLDESKLNGSEPIVALKVLTGSAKKPEENLQRLKREALAMLSCRHENVVRIHDFVATGELCYLSMEFCERGDLHQILEARQNGKVPIEKSLSLLHQILSGLEVIHRAGIVHRDIKPENLLLDDTGALKIADFGIAYLPTERADLESANRGIGTFEYLAPEYLESGVVTPSIDLFSAGVVTYQLLTGHMPFEGQTFTEHIQHKVSGIRPPLKNFVDDVPPHLESLLDLALATDTTKRFQSARAFREAVEAVINGTWDSSHISIRESEPPSLTEATTDRTPAVEEESPQESDPTAPMYSYDEEQLTPRESFYSAAKEAFYSDEQANQDDPPAELPDEENLQALEEAVDEQAFFWSSRLVIGAAALLLIFGSVFLYRLTSTSSVPAAEFLSASDRSQLPFPLSVELRSGLLTNVFESGSDISLLVVPVPESSLAFVILGITGWKPVKVDLSSLSAGGSVLVASNGLRFELSLEEVGTESETVRMRGRYTDQTTGREGTWLLWNS